MREEDLQSAPWPLKMSWEKNPKPKWIWDNCFEIMTPDWLLLWSQLNLGRENVQIEVIKVTTATYLMRKDQLYYPLKVAFDTPFIDRTFLLGCYLKIDSPASIPKNPIKSKFFQNIPNVSKLFQNIPLFPKFSKGLSSLKNWQKPEKRVKFLEGLRQLLMVQPAGKSISKVHPIF